MRSDPSDQICQKRRAVMVMLATAIVSPGCASRYPKSTVSSVGIDKLAFVEPRYAPDLKLNISAWANMPSAATLAKERGEINLAVGAWAEPVVTSFSNALVSSLQEKRIFVERLSQNDFDARSRKDTAFVHSFLTAGFVYRTFTSSTFAPFVQVVLELVGNGGRVIYHQLYVATDRPFNMFMNSLPPSTPYLLSSLDSLRTEGSLAIEALKSLAAQLGTHFASELL